LPLLSDAELIWVTEQGFAPLLNVQNIQHALTNKVFLLTFSNNQQVIFKRLNIKARDLKSRVCELEVQHMLSEQGLTPKVFACCEQYKLQEYIPGQLLSEACSETNIINLLTNQLSIIHQSPALHAPPQRLAFELNKLKNQLQSKIDEDKFTQLILLASDLDKSSPRNVLCHGDLSLNNIILSTDNTVKILDWEYACIACAAYDLAACICINQLNRKQRNDLIEQYYLLNHNTLSLSFPEFKSQCARYLSIFIYLSELWGNCFIEPTQ
jgi:thiamine kinase-like enzyme